MNRFALAALLALVLVFNLAPAALADAEHYEELSSFPADYRASVASPLDGADSTDCSTPLMSVGANRSLIPVKQNTSLYVRVDMSVSGATCTVYAVGFVKTAAATYRSLGIAGISTATAGTRTRASGRYLHDGWLLFDTGTATHLELRKEDPTNSATVTLIPWVGAYDPSGVVGD